MFQWLELCFFKRKYIYFRAIYWYSFKIEDHEKITILNLLLKQSNFRIKFFIVLWKYMVLWISLHFACLFYTILDTDGILWFIFTNVERGPRSNFWDHLQHFQTNGFRAIEPNKPIFRVKAEAKEARFTERKGHKGKGKVIRL